MFSWLNFEELLIHNPVELINPNNDVISVAMNKKQYVDFFSNKYTYNGLYYDEEMDFCLFYYADPLQSYKEGDVYAQGYIDVEMKIYRVRWLCNVSISRSSGLLQTTDGTQGVPQEGGKYTHTAWAYSSDGADRFTTVYPNLNLLNFKSNFTFGKYLYWNTGMMGQNNVQRGTFDYIPVTPNAKYTFSAKWGNFKAFSIFGFKSKTDLTATSIFSGVSNTWIPLSNIGQFVNSNTTITIPSEINYIRMSWFSSETLTLQGLLDAKPKVEEGSVATPWIPSASEVTTADWPSYIGQYTDTILEDSTNPSSYTWKESQEEKWNISKTEMLVSSKAKTITMVLNGALSRCTINKDITGWQNIKPNSSYNYRQPQYSLDIGGDDFVISGYGLRGLKNG